MDEAPEWRFWHPKGGPFCAAGQSVHGQVLPAHGYRRRDHAADRSTEPVGEPRVTARTTARTCSSPNRRSATYAIKPMNCPGAHPHLQRQPRSTATCRCATREFGRCHRDRALGALHGLMRVRGFTQDDAPHLLQPRIRSNPSRVAFRRRRAEGLSRTSGSPTSSSIPAPSRPTPSITPDEQWEKAEEALERR